MPILSPDRLRPFSVALRIFAVGAMLLVLLGTSVARADFAPPPESPYRLPDPNPSEAPPASDDRAVPWEPPPAGPASTFRLQVGPALLLQPMGPGLFTALDIGQRAVGARVSAAWLRAESEQGLAAYTGELWIDFRHQFELHPIIGAGASLLRGGALGRHDSVGAGMLRGALEYELPIADADARVSFNLIALVPAIGTERTKPWTLGTVLVGAGF